MTLRLVVPVGDGDCEGTVTLVGDPGSVRRAMDAARDAVYASVRAEFDALPPKERAKRKPCGCR